MLTSTIRLTFAALLAGISTPVLAQGTWRATQTGVEVTPEQGPERAVRLQVYGDGLIRVTAAPTGFLSLGKG